MYTEQGVCGDCTGAYWTVIADEYLARLNQTYFFGLIWGFEHRPSLPELRKLIGAFDGLSLRAMEILALRYGGDGKSVGEVAAHFDVSGERIRQIEIGALTELCAAVGAPPPGDRRRTAHTPGGGDD